MNQLKLVIRSLKYYFKSNLWIALGVAITTAVITGGLIVGDSVTYSLEQATNLRLGKISHALTSGDRFFTQALSQSLNDSNTPSSAVLQLEAIASSNGGQLKLNKVQVWGIDENFPDVSGSKNSFNIPSGTVNISENTAVRLNLSEGDEVLLKIEKASLIPANAPFVSDEEKNVSIRSKVNRIVSTAEMGRLSLQTSQTAPFNVFISIEHLNKLMDMKQKANVLLLSTQKTEQEIRQEIQTVFTLEDATLELSETEITDQWELKSERVFIDDAIAQRVENLGLNFTPILTYFTNSFTLNQQQTPYSFISTLPDSEIGENELVINRWLANDLNASVGDSIEINYFKMGLLRELNEASHSFRVKEIVEIEGYFADQSLLPQIPGLSDSESCSDWQTGVPVDLKSIRDKDEEYWYENRGLPKAFVAYSQAKELWGNRYGSSTSFRFDRTDINLEELEALLKEQINLFELNFQLRSVKKEGLYAATNGTDFSQLFIGLSFFILVSGIILIALLFRFSLEKRTHEIGTLSALGFSNKKILSIFLHEGVFVALTGSALGLLLAIAYNKLVFWGLNQVWNEIVRTEVLVSKIKITTLLIGFVISLIVSLLTIYLTLRKKLKQNTASLQKKSQQKVSKLSKIGTTIAAAITLIFGLTTIGIELLSKNGNLNSGKFFMAGGILLVAFMLIFYLLLIKKGSSKNGFRKLQLITQNIRLNRSRSLSVVLLLAIGTYLVVSTGLNRQDLFSQAENPKSGTGGYLYWAESTLPVLHNLNNETYRKEQGLNVDFEIIQMRVSEGDDASCLNLNLISNPRILGVDEALLEDRFSVQTMTEDVDEQNFWDALHTSYEDCVPAIADQTVIQWGLGKQVGDTVVYQNALGKEVKLLLVAGLKASVFQGSLLISNQNFIKHFPSSSGSQVFLIDGNKENQQAIADELELNYRDYGFEITPTAQRLAEFKSVENTYLSIFLVLGAFGLLIGTIGLAIVLQRSMLERRSEFALLAAVGFKTNSILTIVSVEYIVLLFIGLIFGTLTAVLSVYPVIQSSIETVSMGFVIRLLSIILLNGVVWIIVLAALQLKNMKLVKALRSE